MTSNQQQRNSRHYSLTLRLHRHSIPFLLLWWAMLRLTACRSTPEEPPIPLTAGQLVRLQGWYVDGRASQPTTSSADTLRWLAVDKDSYYIVHALDSRYAYDEQNRLSQQTVNG